ncbi:PREDICTED: SWI/SNF-related matrix-associated actin-dependent regulator of chromatin subfamily A-like protein 1 isoform X2 [Nelumbo nucifera]|uniref:SWI/SNF-related matrix-associated actin-dependent regulator of chromatin subfamily A-like protein 1 isoform X2 n=1 Tax=Nelumbo nucifera TaxID=4432 RepID=A0A1U8QBL3_NELNU|nr:PREDICTED: SWI/SNF-related matrix-associated actin-dependent regulator of chromatin subfamily A-like protein 1 isoform X2 [Nelumbo nucifera]
MALDDDDWNFSVEELDSLEREALKKIAERKISSATASVSSSSHETPSKYFQQSPAKPTTESRFDSKVEATSPVARVLPMSMPFGGIDNDNGKELPKLSVHLFLHASGNIAAKFPYDPVLINAFRKIPKASWHGKERLWMFPLPSLSSAEKVLGELDGSNIQVEKLDPLVRRAIAAAFAVPDLRDLYDRMPCSIESKLLPFQRDGVRFVLQHGGRALLADEMGLGKTLQAIAVAGCVRDSWPVLVLTPSSLRLHWASMVQQWLNIPSSDIVVVLSQWGGSNRAGFTIVQSSAKGTIHLDGVFNIVSYDVIPKLQHLLMASEFKMSHTSSRMLKQKGLVLLFQLYRKPNLQFCSVGLLLCHDQLNYSNSWKPCIQKYIKMFMSMEIDIAGGIFGIYQGASNHEELHNLMKATVMIRRLKKDVLSELPVKRRQQVFLDLAEKDMRQINALFRELEVVKNKIKACNLKEEVESLKFSEKNLINKIYTDSAEAKIPAVLDYLGTVIEAGCKFLIFAHHQAMIDAIFQFLRNKKVGCIRIDGGTPASSRQTLVSDFQEKDDIKAAVLSIKAGGVGLTLTAASTVIFAELSWTPGDIIQAEDRAHRIGQVSSVNIYYLLANDTVDDIIWDVVQSKLENLGQMLDGHENTLEVSVSESTRSPAKRGPLDSFVKRCNKDESGPRQKYARH